MSDADAYATFKAVRFADNGGKPFCPGCGCDAVYEYECRREFKCKACEKRFSVTSGTIFANRKLSYRDLLTAIVLCVNGANGYHSRIRRAQRGVYLRLTGGRLQNYADELSWRDDHRRVSNGQQFQKVLGGAARLPTAPEWVGHWQKRSKQAA